MKLQSNNFLFSLLLFLTLICEFFDCRTAASAENEKTLGAYQVYKSDDELWLMIDVDKVQHRGAGAEPPVTYDWTSVKVFRIKNDGALKAWTVHREPGFSANTNFGFLFRLKGSIYLRSLENKKAIRLTAGDSNLKELEVINEFAVQGRRAENDSLKLTEHDVYGMGEKVRTPSQNLTSIQLIFTDNSGVGGSQSVIAKNETDRGRWRKPLIDLGDK